MIYKTELTVNHKTKRKFSSPTFIEAMQKAKDFINENYVASPDFVGEYKVTVNEQLVHHTKRTGYRRVYTILFMSGIKDKVAKITRKGNKSKPVLDKARKALTDKLNNKTELHIQQGAQNAT